MELLLEEERVKVRQEGESSEKKYLGNIRKLSQEKIHLEEINAELQIEIKKLRVGQSMLVDNALKDNNSLTTSLQERVAKLEKELALMR